MPSNKNKVIVASAGSRKTTLIVEDALALRGGEVLITTYTNENLSQINDYLVQMNGHVPKNITVLSWFSFLLQDGVRPYQNHLTSRDRIRSIIFGELPQWIRRVKKNDVDRYYLTQTDDIYSERVADFVCRCNDQANGLVIRRLEKIFAHIFIDEFQDFAGYDLELLHGLLASSISVTAVCDPRQATFATNNSSKNSRFKKSGIFDWVKQKASSGILSLEERTDCYRSNQAICDFADALFPDLPKTTSRNKTVTGHDGVFTINRSQVCDYVRKHAPMVLRNNKAVDTMSLSAINIGLSKGRTYDRVLIFTTKPMRDYLDSGDISKAGDLARLYVAVTRARYSAAFVV
jgi:ATP-dependent DNA helicase UvrD/PcrA